MDMDEKMIKDGLYNLSMDAMTDDKYSQGILVGIVTGIMATTKMNFGEAMEICKNNMPMDIKIHCIPQGWM